MGLPGAGAAAAAAAAGAAASKLVKRWRCIPEKNLVFPPSPFCYVPIARIIRMATKKEEEEEEEEEEGKRV